MGNTNKEDDLDRTDITDGTKNCPAEIDWRNLTDFVDKPVYEARSGKWHILKGYKQYGDTKDVYLSDIKEAKPFSEVALYPTDVGMIKAPNFGNEGKKFGKR